MIEILKVLVDLFQKVAGSSACALAATAVAEYLERRFLLPSFSLRLQHQRKADKGLKHYKFRVLNIKFAPKCALTNISANRTTLFL